MVGRTFEAEGTAVTKSWGAVGPRKYKSAWETASHWPPRLDRAQVVVLNLFVAKDFFPYLNASFERCLPTISHPLHLLRKELFP